MNNFGVYQPPSGIDNIRRSTQVNSINNLNNPRKTFDEMIEQGWGGNIPGGSEGTPLSPSPSPSPSPSSSFIPLPPGNLTPAQINAAMQTRTCSNPCVTFNYNYPEDQPWDFENEVWINPTFGRRQTYCWGSVPGQTGPNDEEFGWISFGANMGADALDNVFGPESEAISGSFFTVDSDTRSRCFSPSPPPSPPPSPSLGGNASPPPPPGKDMCGCPCNTIATIVEDKICGLDKGIKDHIDQRTIEELKVMEKMLKGMKIGLSLQPIIDRLNQVEANLWNGPGG